MPATDYQGCTAAAAFGRSIMSLRREQVYAMGDGGHEPELEAFQKHVAERFVDLAGVGSDELLSLSWIRKLLDSFLLCQEEFKVILFNNRSTVSRAPLDRLVHEFYERSVKALDVCNAVRDGIERIREWQKLLEIVLFALDNQRLLGEGQFRRAKKALLDLSISMLDERESVTEAALAHRNRSFGRQTAASRDQHRRTLGHFRSLSWSVSRSWSAAKQIQAIGNNLVAPKSNEIVATNGIAVPVFTMSSILLFVMWALVAAIPCQDRGLQVHFSIPRQFAWAGPMLALHERVVEESRKRDRRNACGLLREIYRMDKFSRAMNVLADSVVCPLTEEKEREVKQRVVELRQILDGIKEELCPLERQVREVFHRIVRGRTEGLDFLGKLSHGD
uniref:Uncharacterized protein MANES_02G179700 n=1 Tax=Rhizophora mucronata TaxID=61149 RepID=A0A2P2J933_RHIMU